MTRILMFSAILLLPVTPYHAQLNDDAVQPKKGLGKTADEIVETLLKQMDTDKDGKISRDEAKGKLAASFEKIDTNKDGYLDRKEMRAMAERSLAQQKGR